MKTKTIVFGALLFFSILSFAQQAPSTQEILDNAYQEAKKEDKNVMVIFHASWCGWCKKMDKQMNDESVKSYFDSNYVIEHLAVHEAKDKKYLENEGSLELLKKYNADKTGIPFFLIFDDEGKFLADSFNTNGQNIGCPASKEEVAEFIKIIKETSNLKGSELEIIKDTFLAK